MLQATKGGEQAEGQGQTKERFSREQEASCFSVTHSYKLFRLTISSLQSHPKSSFGMGAPATNSETIHVVNKADNRQHAVVNLDSSLDEELPVSALRARPILLGLTSNNLSYARGGDLLHWYAGCRVSFRGC